MKKLILFFLVLPFVLTSCGSDNDDDINKTDNLLVGTVWNTTVTEGNYEKSHTFYFALNNKCSYESKMADFTPFKTEYRYTFNSKDNTLIIKYISGADAGSGKVEGDKMYLHYDDKDYILAKVR